MKALKHLTLLGGLLLGGLLLGGLPLFVGNASAYSVSLTGGNTGNVVKWPTAKQTYYLHPSCSADLNNQACLNEVRASFQVWEDIGCSALDFTDQGFSNNLQLTAVNGGTNDKNEFGWIENNAWFYGTYTLGVTAPWFSQDGVVFEADIAMNGYQQTWSMSGQNFSTDVRNVSVHEIGHFFGAQHVLGGFSQNDPPTMAPTADPYMNSQTPNADDQAGACYLYPQGAWSCQNNDDCPFVNDDGPQGEYYAGVLSCQSGSCGGFSNQLPEGDGQIGEDCVADTDCESPLFCQPLQGSSGVCASQCQTSNPNCPSGFDCIPYSNSPGTGVCIEGDGGGGNNNQKANGQPCSSSAECQSFLCINESGGAVCRQKCFSANECPSGEECNPLQGVNYGACFPVQGGGTTGGTTGDAGKALGENCNSADECDSTMCAGSDGVFVCVQPCINSSQCASGQECFPLQGGGGACFGDQGGGDTGGGQGLGVGDTCEDSGQCISGQCVSVGGGAAFCTDTCGNTADCPCGMKCQELQGGQVLCIPGEPVACLGEGEACSSAGQCANNSCVDGSCATTCSIFQGAAGCPAQTGCQRTAEASPAGVCASPGQGEIGSVCSNDGGCQSLFCHAGTCGQPCDLTSPICSSCQAAAGSVGYCADVAATTTGGGTDGSVATGVDGGTGGETAGTAGATTDLGGAASASGGDDGGNNGDTPTSSCTASPGSGPTSPMAPTLLVLVLAGLGLSRRHGKPLPTHGLI